MRNMSFFHTAEQVRSGIKSVTRRTGWAFLKPGDRFSAVVKARGVPRDQIERLGVCTVVAVRRERLDAIDAADVKLVGYPDIPPGDFVAMFCRINPGCGPDTVVTRIEFVLGSDTADAPD